MNKRKYFGTDGIRGRVGQYPITPEFAIKLGWAAGRVLSSNSQGTVVIGKDTRISGYMIESALEAGLSAAGLNVALTGPMPTPAIAYLTRTLRAQAGIVISASHNPYWDNGIKFFSGNGNKLPDEVEQLIEQELDKALVCVESARLGKATRIADAAGRYIEFCKSTFSNYFHLNGLKIVVDCANGATYHIAPNVLNELGADVVKMSCHPDGININEQCGATNTQALQKRVVAEGADLGIALDGDGDRIIMVDHLGNSVDGDQILFILARDRQLRGILQGGVVGTLMSNMGLEVALKQHTIDFCRANVGDRYVLEKMKALNWKLGAENSGHVIIEDKTTTGDGIIAGLQVIAAMVRHQKNLYEICQGITLMPQQMINVKFEEQHDPLESKHVQQAVKNVEQQLQDKGRVLLRKSGTEPVIRVMVEAEEESTAIRLAKYIAETIC